MVNDRQAKGEAFVVYWLLEAALISLLVGKCLCVCARTFSRINASGGSEQQLQQQ